MCAVRNTCNLLTASVKKKQKQKRDLKTTLYTFVYNFDSAVTLLQNLCLHHTLNVSLTKLAPDESE